jgi:uncharacterized protein
MVRCAPKALACILALLLFACGAPESPRQTAPRVLRVGASAEGAGFFALSHALAPLIEKRLVDTRLEIHETAGAIDNLQAVRRGDLDFALTYADAAYDSHRPGLEPPQTAAPALGVAVVQIVPLQFVAGASSGITRLSDLRGRRVSIGLEGGGTILLVRDLLQAAGVAEQDIVRASVPIRDAAQMVVNGRLDAFFDLAAHSDAVSYAVERGAHIIPIHGAVVTELLASRPFLRAVAFPVGVEVNERRLVPSIGVEAMVICRGSLGTTQVHDFTQALLASLREVATNANWSLVPSDEAAGTSIPLHPGAAKYFREQELLR